MSSSTSKWLNLNNEKREIALHSEVLFPHCSYRSMAYNRHFYLYQKYRNLGPNSSVLPLCTHSHLNMSFLNCHLHLQMAHLISNWHILMALLIYSLWLIPVERKWWANLPPPPNNCNDINEKWIDISLKIWPWK